MSIMGKSNSVGYRTIAYRAAASAAVAVAFAGCSITTLGADAGDDTTVSVGEAPKFDGCGSRGDSLKYSWKIIEAPADRAEDVGKVLRESISECSFTLESDMELAEIGTWVVELTVTDGSNTETDQVTITVA